MTRPDLIEYDIRNEGMLVLALAHAIWEAKQEMKNRALPVERLDEVDHRLFEQAGETEQIEMVNLARHCLGMLPVGANIG
jgi:hypothetical protein